MTVYYNEFDPHAAAWLRELIKRGLIANGEVDERSIVDVRADELRGFTQCHFFAGIGGWSYALRLAGWPDDKPVWTGSPPCQPFSAAGKGLAAADERHLAPHFAELVAGGRPRFLFGEQVASAAVFGKAASGAKRARSGDDGASAEWCWLDDLSDRLEAARYAVGASDIPAAFVGAPHIRQRTFFGAVRLADAAHAGSQGHWRKFGSLEHPQGRQDAAGYGPTPGANGGLANAAGAGGCGGVSLQDRRHGEFGRPNPVQFDERSGFAALSGPRGLADAELQQRSGSAARCDDARGRDEKPTAVAGLRSDLRPSPFNSPWRDVDWLFCRDAKWRAVEPASFPLAHGIPARVVRLRGYGNAINPWAAAAFIGEFTGAVNEVAL